jgi:glycerol kinase
MKGKFLLAIDQGTSSSRTVIYDHDARVVASAQQEFPQIYPQPGWVEHDPEAIWESVTSVTGGAMRKAGAAAADISAIGITNQRETTLIWDRETGECVYNAIVWQDRRTADYCQSLKDDGLEAVVTEKTGLRLDRARSRGSRETRVRYDRQFPLMAADRWPGTCDGCDQRVANPPVQYTHADVG